MLPFRGAVAAVLATLLLVTGAVAFVSARIPVVSARGGEGVASLALPASPHEHEFESRAAARRSEELRRLLSLRLGPANAAASTPRSSRIPAEMPVVAASPMRIAFVANQAAVFTQPERPAIPLMFASLAPVAPAAEVFSAGRLDAAMPSAIEDATEPSAQERSSARGLELAALPPPAAISESNPGADDPPIVAREIPDVEESVDAPSADAPIPSVVETPAAPNAEPREHAAAPAPGKPAPQRAAKKKNARPAAAKARPAAKARKEAAKKAARAAATRRAAQPAAPQNSLGGGVGASWWQEPSRPATTRRRTRQPDLEF